VNNVQQVKELITAMKNAGVPLQIVCWKGASACVGYPYVYGAVGEECKPAKRAQYGTKFYPSDHKTIVTKCKAISWDSKEQKAVVTGSCSGCQWNLPVMMFDCRGFTRKLLDMVYGFTLWGGTVGGQWNDERNWKEKGTIDRMPKDTLCCLFVYKNNKWQHTGFGYNEETVECSNGVEHYNKRKAKWTHFGVPKCVDYEPLPTPEGYAVVTGKSVALRKEPSKSAVIITRVNTGELVKLETMPEPAWDYVSYNGNTGWMMKEFLKEDGQTATVTGVRVALRVDPCQRSSIIMRINTGQKVAIEDAPESLWDYVSYNGKTGYMMKEFLKEN